MCYVTAGGSGSYTVAVRSSDYLCCLRDQALLSVTVLAVVSETGKGWVSKVPCRLHRPDLTLLVDGKQGGAANTYSTLSDHGWHNQITPHKL